MIHPSSIIETGVQLGVGVSVGAFSYIEKGAVIDDHCVIGPRVTIFGHTTLGKRCRVHSGAVLGDEPQDTSFKECETFLRVGANTVLREGVTLHRGTVEGTTTTIGEDCFLMAHAHCAHNCVVGNGVIVANAALLAGHAHIGDRAFVSGNCLVHQFVHIGRLAMLGGGCGVSKDVPPFCLVAPMLPNTVHSLNTVGLRRAGIDAAQRLQVRRAFDLFYHAGLNCAAALARIRAEVPGELAEEFCRFVEASKRGICAAGSSSGGESGEP